MDTFRPDNAWDNAAAESFFGTLKREHANRRRWATRADARRDLIRWIEGWYNQREPPPQPLRRRAPAEFEDAYTAQQADQQLVGNP